MTNWVIPFVLMVVLVTWTVLVAVIVVAIEVRLRRMKGANEQLQELLRRERERK